MSCGLDFYSPFKAKDEIYKVAAMLSKIILCSGKYWQLQSTDSNNIISATCTILKNQDTVIEQLLKNGGYSNTAINRMDKLNL